MDAIGDAVTGSILVSAIEPRTGEAGDDGHTHERNCLNCAAPLAGPYCSACGQKAHVHRSLRAFAGDFAAGLMNFEGKFWRTLPMLVWRPGDLTRRYIAGERARFISPVALYLFSVFAMFAVLNFNGALTTPAGTIRTGIAQEAAEQKARIARLEGERKNTASAGRSTQTLDNRLAKARKDLGELEALREGRVVSERGEVDLSREGVPQWIQPFIEKARDNPELVVTKVQDAASKYSWMLIPISVPFLWLLFPFSRRYRLYDHTVFVTYSLAFMMVLAIVGGLLVAAGQTAIAGFLFFVPPIHMYRQLKQAYGLGRISALLRTLLLVTFAFIAVVLFALVIAAVGIAD